MKFSPLYKMYCTFSPCLVARKYLLLLLMHEPVTYYDPSLLDFLTRAPNFNFGFSVEPQPESSILTGRFMLLLVDSSGDGGTHQGAGSEILIAPAQPCREPHQQFCISDCVTLCISLLL